MYDRRGRAGTLAGQLNSPMVQVFEPARTYVESISKSIFNVRESSLCMGQRDVMSSQSIFLDHFCLIEDSLYKLEMGDAYAGTRISSTQTPPKRITYFLFHTSHITHHIILFLEKKIHSKII